MAMRASRTTASWCAASGGLPARRWRENCWFVPGVRAARRLDVWMAGELDAIDRHADAKGRDDFSSIRSATI